MEYLQKIQVIYVNPLINLHKNLYNNYSYFTYKRTEAQGR